MKTPMQELVDELKSELHISYNLPEEREYNSGLRAALVMAEGMLEKEKKMLEAVWFEAQEAYYGDAYIKPSDPTFDEYYNKTFNTEE